MKRRNSLLFLSGVTACFFSMATVSFAGVPDGAIVFERNCSVCHSVNPPPKSAPPIIPLANRYHQRFQMKEQGVAFMIAYLKKPDKQKSIDQQAVARFGLMPAIQLPDTELRAVAEWFWNQSNPAYGAGGGRGPGRMNP
ncbi:MAG: cytochrome c [Chlorobiaceae bacterium]|nr:cytochrome c [Chlorobiaceae bacterium]